MVALRVFFFPLFLTPVLALGQPPTKFMMAILVGLATYHPTKISPLCSWPAVVLTNAKAGVS